MADDTLPATWRDAFLALPPEPAPAGGWERVAARMAQRRAPRLSAWIGLATAAALALVLVWPVSPDAEVEPSHARLYALYSESAQLEALLALARDDRMANAGALVLGEELDAQVAAIDASLARSGLSDEERLRLWQARVDALRLAAGFESTQRLLASQGRGEMLLVSVD